MKLKYYLRGLGIGIAVTAVLLSISSKDGQTLTDAQIRERAVQLGMVDNDAVVLADLQTEENLETQTTPQTQEEQETQIETSSQTQEETQSEEDIQAGEETAQTGEDSQGREEQETPMETNSQTQEEQPQESAGNEEILQPSEELSGAAVSITVNPGDTSLEVSRALAEAGLVQDAESFDRYLCDYGYSRTINTGTYEIMPGTSDEEIAEIISGKR